MTHDSKLTTTVIGPNPAIDHLLEVPGFRAGEVWRSRRSIRLAGGKPVNAARTLRQLGMPVRLISPLGGEVGEGELIAQACRDLGIELEALPIAGATRTCVIVVDSRSGDSTVVNEQGPKLSAEEAEAYRRLVIVEAAAAGLVLGSGSVPPGVSPDLYTEVGREVAKRGGRFILDAAGEVLQRAMATRPWAVKVNGEEAMAATRAADVVTAAQRLREAGAEHAVVTLGAEGALYAGPEGRLRVSPAPVKPLNPVGSGDAFLAGLAAGVVQGQEWPDALRRASAVAGLAASRFEPDMGTDPELELEPLLERVQVEKL